MRSLPAPSYPGRAVTPPRSARCGVESSEWLGRCRGSRANECNGPSRLADGHTGWLPGCLSACLPGPRLRSCASAPRGGGGLRSGLAWPIQLVAPAVWRSRPTEWGSCRLPAVERPGGQAPVHRVLGPAVGFLAKQRLQATSRSLLRSSTSMVLSFRSSASPRTAATPSATARPGWPGGPCPAAAPDSESRPASVAVARRTVPRPRLLAIDLPHACPGGLVQAVGAACLASSSRDGAVTPRARTRFAAPPTLDASFSFQRRHGRSSPSLTAVATVSAGAAFPPGGAHAVPGGHHTPAKDSRRAPAGTKLSTRRRTWPSMSSRMRPTVARLCPAGSSTSQSS